jgi:hypothetical protein
MRQRAAHLHIPGESGGDRHVLVPEAEVHHDLPNAVIHVRGGLWHVGPDLDLCQLDVRNQILLAFRAAEDHVDDVLLALGGGAEEHVGLQEKGDD